MRNRGIEYIAPGEMEFADLGEAPEPGPGQIRLRTLFSGITNGTERHTLLGEHGWTHFPGRHGYQHACRIDALGEGVHGFDLGDAVFFGQYVGHRGWHLVNVGPADPEDYRSHLVQPLPPELPLHAAALLGVAGVAMRAVRRCRVAPTHRVWVVGAGLIGQFAAQAARAFGAHVVVSDIDPARLEQARLCGAHEVIDANTDDAATHLQQAGPYQRIIDAAGVGSLFHEIQRLGVLDWRGAIAAIAVRRETHLDWSMLHGLEASIEVSCHFGLADLKHVIFFMQQGIIQVDPLITHRVPIDEAPRIYEMLRDRPREMLGTVFDWS